MAGKNALLHEVLAEIRDFCARNASESQRKKYARFFTEGYDAYGVPKDMWEANRTRFYDAYKDRLSLEDFFDLGDLLFESGKYEEGSAAIVSVSEMLDKFTPDSFQRAGLWLEQGVRNWAHSDLICGMILSPCLNRRSASMSDLSAWRDSASKWKRRAVPVTMLSLLKGKGKTVPLLKFIEPMILDGERVVHQGLGWFLREAWRKDPVPVENLLLKWKEKAPRLIYQYATEKMSPEQKQRFRRSKPA